MAFEENLDPISIEAGENLSTYQYHYVKVYTDGTAKLCGDAELALGVLQNAPTIGQAANVSTGGESKVVAVSGVAAGDLVNSDSAGRATPAGSNEYANGIAREDCNVTGQIITVSLFRGYKHS